MWVEKNGPTWRIRDLRPGGGKVTLAKGYPTCDAANEAMILLRADRLRGEALAPGGDRILLADFCDEWWPNYRRGLKPTTRQSEGARLTNHIVYLLGHLALGDIDVPVVEQWLADLTDGRGGMPPGEDTGRRRERKRRPLAPKTVHNCHGLLYTVLDAAIAHKKIRINPCASSAKSLPGRKRKEMRFLSDPEIARLIAAMPAHYRPLVILLVATGLRWGEAIGLRIKNVDLLAARPQLRVLEHLHELGDGELVWTDPKSEASRRTVSFTRRVALTLTPLVAGRGDEETLFTTVNGLTIRTRNFRRIWTAACKKAGLAGLRVHDLRHSHAAILIAANRPLLAISRRLGHSSITVTMTLYGHLREEIDEGILTAVDASLSLVPAEVEAEVADELDGERLAA